MITLVLGGARSGKSAVAERLVGSSSVVATTYVATTSGIDADPDLAARVEVHRARRPTWWSTVEATGAELMVVLRAVGGTVLLDSLGAWLAGLPDFRADTELLVDALCSRDGDTVVVSDEVGLGVHPATDAGRRFRDALGALNQTVAATADRVLFVAAGQVLVLSPIDAIEPAST